MFGGSFGNHNTQVNYHLFVTQNMYVKNLPSDSEPVCILFYNCYYYSSYFMQPQVFLNHLLIYNAGKPLFSKTVLTRIISIVRVPSLWFNKDTHNNSDDELKCFSLSVKLVETSVRRTRTPPWWTFQFVFHGNLEEKSTNWGVFLNKWNHHICYKKLRGIAKMGFCITLFLYISGLRILFNLFTTNLIKGPKILRSRIHSGYGIMGGGLS